MKILATILLLGGLSVGCASTTHLPAGEPGTDADESIVWEQSRAEQQRIRDNGLLYRDPRLAVYLSRIARRLEPDTLPGKVRIRVFVVEDPLLNAFAFPDGSIYFHTGLLAHLENEAQFAAILAHEIAHCVEQHAFQAFRRFSGRTAALAVFQENLSRLGPFSRLIQAMGADDSVSAFSSYCRELELEADRVGLDLMLRAHYDPSEALEAFGHLKKEILRNDLVQPIYRTIHPTLEERVAVMRDRVAAFGCPSRPTIVNSEAFLEHTRDMILDNAWLDLKFGRFESAADVAEKYRCLAPGDPRVHFLLGEIARQQGGVESEQRALAHYQHAIRLDPNFAEPHKSIGIIHFKAGHHRLARKHFDACLSMSPYRSDEAYIRNYLRRCSVTGEGS
jgi:predicted Zn-dependent protease